MTSAMGAEDGAAVKARRVEVREIRVSADYRHHANGGIVWGSGTMLKQYAVIVDGRRVDSFMSRERAEAAAERLREKHNA